MGTFLEVLNFNRLFLKLHRFNPELVVRYSFPLIGGEGLGYTPYKCWEEEGCHEFQT